MATIIARAPPYPQRVGVWAGLTRYVCGLSLTGIPLSPASDYSPGKTRILLGVFVSGCVFSLTDWVFAGILFHDKYSAHPEIRRLASGKSDVTSVAWV
jgi:hypothetical protein